MSYDNRVTIERATNGYTITMRDPKIVASNRKRDLKSDSYTPYQDPEKTYVFTDMAGLTTFLTSNLDKALPKDDFDTSFDEMTDEDPD